jgi:hypothetical protein
MEDGAMVVGTATTLCYDHRFAWIGMVLVDPGFRNRESAASFCSGP